VIEVTVDPGAWSGADAGTEALLEKWLVEEGATVQEGQPIAEVMLVKAVYEVVAPASGRLVKQMVATGDTVPQGAPIALIENA
jgi:pyruvate/2-oxoglutarate dehydrogenase complex dihydrolipoamide acyltransferase (E2) component